MKKQITKKTAPKKAAVKGRSLSAPTTKKATAKKAAGKGKSLSAPTTKKATPKKEKETKVDATLIHQIDWLTADVVNGYFMGVDSDILSKAEMKKLIQDTHNHQELFDYLSVDPKTCADFAEFLLFYMHTLVFTGAASTVLKEWKEDSAKSSPAKKKK